MSLRRLFRSPTVGSIADWTALGQLVLPLCGGGALLSWFASSIEGIMQYGWGAAVFAGLAALCVLILFLSIAAVAWRIYRPIAPAPVTPNVSDILDAPTVAPSQIDEIFERLRGLDGQTRLLLDISNDIKGASAGDIARLKENLTAIAEKMMHIDGLLKPDVRHLTLLGRLGETSEPPKNKFESISKDIDAANARLDGLKDALTHLIKEANEQIEVWKRQSSMHYSILANSLRARDAIAIIKEADAIVLDLGKKLIEAGSFKCDDDWKVSYVHWHDALQKIDQVVGWWNNDRSPILQISGRDLESTGYVAPAHIVTKDDSNRIRYRTVWIAQQTYANRKDGIFAFFESKAGELPG